MKAASYRNFGTAGENSTAGFRPKLRRAGERESRRADGAARTAAVRHYFLRTTRTVDCVACRTKTCGPRAYLRHNSSV